MHEKYSEDVLYVEIGNKQRDAYTEKSVHLDFILLLPLEKEKKTVFRQNCEKLQNLIMQGHVSELTCSQRFW